VYSWSPIPVFAFSLPPHALLRYPPGMPAPEHNHVQVVRCKGVGCGRNVPTPVEVRVRTGSITVLALSVWSGGPTSFRRKCSWDRCHGKSRAEAS
jgi:hypothetical protein